MTTGEKLKRDLGLLRFKYVYIQKIINTSIRILKITVFSRYPNVTIPISKVENQVSTQLYRVAQEGGKYKKQKYKYSYPVLIDYFNELIPSNTLIVISDYTSDFFGNNRMFEKLSSKCYVSWENIGNKKLLERFKGMITVEFWVKNNKVMIEYNHEEMEFSEFAETYTDEAYLILNAIYDYMFQTDRDYCETEDNVFRCVGNYVSDYYIKYNKVLDFTISDDGKVVETNKETFEENYRYKRKY